MVWICHSFSVVHSYLAPQGRWPSAIELWNKYRTFNSCSFVNSLMLEIISCLKFVVL